MSSTAVEHQLADFAGSLRLEDVPAPTIEHARALVVDAFACALAGGLAQETDAVVGAAATLGAGGSTVIGRDAPMSESGATLVNSFLITAMTVCDVYRPAHCHMTPLVIPPALAVSEVGLSGAEFLTGVIAGMEVTARVALGLDYAEFRRRGWHSPGVVGPFGAAAAVGRILGFDSKEMRHAFGLAATQSAGSYLSWGTPAVKFHQARGAMSGLLAARLAGAGFPGGELPLTAPDGGIYNTHSHGGDPAAAVAGLGSRWEFDETAIRLWPGASPVQAMLTGLFDILGSSPIEPDTVDYIEVGIAVEDFTTHAGFGRPRGTFEALLSYAYLASVVVHDGDLWFEQVHPDRLEDESLHAYSERVRLVPVEDLPINGCLLTIGMVDGDQRTRRVESARGNPQNPATSEDLSAKFHRAADPTLGPDAAIELLGSLMALESVDDLRPIISILVPGT